jgi:hypothetical protein
VSPTPRNASADEQAVQFIRAELARVSTSDRRRIAESFILAALGSIPWVGGFIGAAATYMAELHENKGDTLHAQWLEEHARKIALLVRTLQDIERHFETLEGQVDERIQSERYLGLVRRAFRVWDRADSDEKRAYVANLVSNAASSRLCSDDVLQRFIEWLDRYDEVHFAVIRELHNTPGTTRFLLWDAIRGALPAEDSAEAELFRLQIHDLEQGGVMAIAASQRAQRLPARIPRRHGTVVGESAFEERQPYELTWLGKQFVHYTMTHAVARLSAPGLPEIRN